MKHSLRATAATALVASIVSAPFILSHSDAQADTPRSDISLPGITVGPTIKVDGLITVGPGITVDIPPVTVPPLLPTQVPTQLPTQGPTQAPSQEPTQPPVEPNTSRPTQRATPNPQPSEEPSTASPVVPDESTPSAGQTSSPSGTVVPEKPDDTADDNDDKSPTVVTKVVIGTLATVLVAVLGILAMFFGYVLGRRDAERYQQGFTKSLVAFARGET